MTNQDRKKLLSMLQGTTRNANFARTYKHPKGAVSDAMAKPSTSGKPGRSGHAPTFNWGSSKGIQPAQVGGK